MFRYLGSKASSAKIVGDIIAELVEAPSVVDPFAGIGTMSGELKSRGFRVTTCDVLNFPHYFQVARIAIDELPQFGKLKEHYELRSIEEIKFHLNRKRAPRSWFVDNYARERRYFTVSNACKIAGIWHQVRRWNVEGLLDNAEKAVLVASLLNSMDKVANTAGTYGAYLKKLSTKSQRSFHFSFLEPVTGNASCSAVLGDAHATLTGKAFDVLYLDPPYTFRSYASYYHLPETLAALEYPKLNPNSKTGVPARPHSASVAIRAATTLEYLKRLIDHIEWKYLVLQYSDTGVIPPYQLMQMLQKRGYVKRHEIGCLGYTTIKHSVRHASQSLYVVHN